LAQAPEAGKVVTEGQAGQECPQRPDAHRTEKRTRSTVVLSQRCGDDPQDCGHVLDRDEAVGDDGQGE